MSDSTLLCPLLMHVFSYYNYQYSYSPLQMTDSGTVTPTIVLVFLLNTS